MKFLLNWSMLLLSNGDSDNIKQKVMLDSNEGLSVFGKLMFVGLRPRSITIVFNFQICEEVSLSPFHTQKVSTAMLLN